VADQSVFEVVGGQPFFDALCRAFYDRVETDAILRPLYPADTGESERSLAAFLAQYFGGPAAYSAAKGHPRLRMRHAHIRIGPAERDAWYADMAAALDDVGAPLPAAVRSAIMEYFARSADWMINSPL
jgi:hemoglobin